jgi:peptidyl-prolyl cis-trans isomerase SurA
MLVSGLLMVVAVSGLSACRTSPNVAAYVGDGQITVAELTSAVDDRLADEDIAAYAKGHEDEFTRRVLTLLVQEEIYAAAADRYDVQVADDAVRARISELLGADNPDDVYAQLAQQGIGREDVFENVRQQLLRVRLATAEGKAEGLDDAALQARYAQVREGLGKVSFGYITVPDDATATKVLAQLTADPGSYGAVAAQYPGAYTLPALDTRSADQVPSVLAEGVAAAKPNTGFTTAVPEAGGVVVTFVAGTVYPTFEEARPDLVKEATDKADAAGTTLVDDVRKDVGVTVNPRYGVLKDGKLVAESGGVVDILKDDAAAAAAAAAGGSGAAPAK